MGIVLECSAFHNTGDMSFNYGTSVFAVFSRSQIMHKLFRSFPKNDVYEPFSPFFPLLCPRTPKIKYR